MYRWSKKHTDKKMFKDMDKKIVDNCFSSPQTILFYKKRVQEAWMVAPTTSRELSEKHQNRQYRLMPKHVFVLGDLHITFQGSTIKDFVISQVLRRRLKL